jgi:hypothetical protein
LAHKYPGRLKCHECRQLHFTNILTDIINKEEKEKYKEFALRDTYIVTDTDDDSSINDIEEEKKRYEKTYYRAGDSILLPPGNLSLKMYFYQAYDNFLCKANIKDTMTIEKRHYISLVNLCAYEGSADWGSRYGHSKLRFADYLKSVVGCSLAEFLTKPESNNNFKKLKKCPWCKIFFVGRPNRKFCSLDCKDDYHNWQHSRTGYAKEAVRKHRAKNNPA